MPIVPYDWGYVRLNRIYSSSRTAGNKKKEKKNEKSAKEKEREREEAVEACWDRRAIESFNIPNVESTSTYYTTITSTTATTTRRHFSSFLFS